MTRLQAGRYKSDGGNRREGKGVEEHSLDLRNEQRVLYKRVWEIVRSMHKGKG